MTIIAIIGYSSRLAETYWKQRRNASLISSAAGFEQRVVAVKPPTQNCNIRLKVTGSNSNFKMYFISNRLVPFEIIRILKRPTARMISGINKPVPIMLTIGVRCHQQSLPICNCHECRSSPWLRVFGRCSPACDVTAYRSLTVSHTKPEQRFRCRIISPTATEDVDTYRLAWPNGAPSFLSSLTGKPRSRTIEITRTLNGYT